MDELNGHLDVIARHAHLGAFRKVDHAGNVGGSEIELRTIVVEERGMTAAFILGQDVHLSGELGVAGNGARLRDDLSANDARTVDTTVTSYVTIDNHTFYASGMFSYVKTSEIGCDTIVNLNLRILDEPKSCNISPNPAKSIIGISSENYISSVEIYSTTGKLVLQKEINANRAEINVEWLVPGVYYVRLFGEDGGQPSVQRFVKE